MTHAPEMMVALSEANVAGLMNLRVQPNESLNSVIGRLRLEHPRQKPCEQPSQPKTKEGQKYVCYVFDNPVYGKTLPDVFANILDVVHDLDSEALERLAKARVSYVRNIISRDKEKIHLGVPSSRVHKSRSGWWFSAVNSQKQTIRHLEELCRVAGIEFGTDIRWAES